MEAARRGAAAVSVRIDSSSPRPEKRHTAQAGPLPRVSPCNSHVRYAAAGTGEETSQRAG